MEQKTGYELLVEVAAVAEVHSGLEGLEIRKFLVSADLVRHEHQLLFDIGPFAVELECPAVVEQRGRETGS